ncbi:LuxR C-terminal-related transcriptional regulator [Ideonella livida]|uniref:HTH luxR-type domain-containing protein n=1 Tax=Ideonella livida TaxID=2707176 RepID=A0A7C9PK40_9BURK|nr:LuxR C-terminal-related transcriptional regulator [Ideonella livida]NDY93191.1 hypothetical protein [Ideonella livida]
MTDPHDPGILDHPAWRCLQAAGAVANRQQFFLWTRLHLHHLVPHELLVVQGLPGGGQARWQELLHSVALPPALLQALADAHHPLWQVLAQATAGTAGPQGLVPEVLAVPEVPQGEVLARGLRQAGLSQLLLLGVDPLAQGRPQGWLLLGCGAQADAAAACRHLAWVWPWVWCAAAAVAVGARQTAGAGVLTARELGILREVRQGLSNAEIGVQLGLSALTVKNTLARILRKLAVHNRAQAVAEAMARRYLD